MCTNVPKVCNKKKLFKNVSKKNVSIPFFAKKSFQNGVLLILKKMVKVQRVIFEPILVHNKKALKHYFWRHS